MRLFLQDVPLVGREKELLQLKAAVEVHPLVTVSGSSGIGKTTLVLSLASELEDAGVWFMSGKFDQKTSSRPFSALSIALEKLLDVKAEEICQIFEADPIDEEDVALICGVVPSLAEVFLSDISPVPSNLTNDVLVSHERMIDALVSIFRTISQHHKLVLFLDDAHWAEGPCLDVVKLLTSYTGSVEEGNTSKLITTILTYRCDEDNSASLSQIIEDCSPLSVELDGLSVEDLNIILAHVLNRRPTEVEVVSLTKVIHRKTHGNGKKEIFSSIDIDCTISCVLR